GYRFNNISISLECQKPKIEPLVDRMKERLSELLDLDPARIGITATSGEGMSREGMGEGIRCSSTVSLIRLGCLISTLPLK
ncbi:MAG: 2-C-methyl-D-erythritol 2,4-cyclodiphosphate synthase, partial [Candidatus Gracilibacteria bacterium]|nr:2-C-methyl-D-erythritol 2,4-cyclodiphosphate synthase [Candidatus Gracilibacteria bacterium]